jgi:hypothetical protein
MLNSDGAAALGLYGLTYRIVDKFGGAENVQTSQVGRVVYAGMTTADYDFQTSAAPLRVRAGNAADDSAGAGARSIRIFGLNGNYDEVSEIVETNGTSAGPATTANFIRVFRAWVETAGASAENVGDVVLETADTSALQAVISAGQGQTRLAFYTVPRGYVGEVVSFTGLVSRSGGSATNGSFALYVREVGATSARRYKGDVASGLGSGSTVEYGGITVNECADVFVVLQSLSANNTGVSAQFKLRLFKKDHLPHLISTS